MIKVAAPMVSAFLLASCNTPDDGSGLTRADRAAMEQRAVQKVGCVVENQARCSHIIENRTRLSLFFAPDAVTQNMDPNEKNKGKRVTRNFVVEAVAAINQCRSPEGEALTVLKNMKIANGLYEFKATSPLGDQSQCFLIQQQEES